MALRPARESPHRHAALAGRRVLVTGGLGFIGSNLVIRLAGLGARVTVVDSLVPGHGGNLANLDPVADAVRVNVSDLRDQGSLRVLVRDQDFVFHLAGQVSHGDSMREPHRDLEVNCIATMNLVEACRSENPGARIVYTSTRQVYGVPREVPVREDHPTQPIDVNGINKLAAEYYHVLYDRTYGIRSAVLRLTNTYGPRQDLHSDRMGFIGVLIGRALRGEPLRLWGDGSQVRDFSYVDDVVEALLLAAVSESCYGRPLNLGSEKRYSLLQFVQLLSQVCPLHYELTPFPDDRKIIDIGDYYGDWSAFAAATGWKPEVELAEGLRRAVDFYRAHESYWR